jgi:hypothetical protein
MPTVEHMELPSSGRSTAAIAYQGLQRSMIRAGGYDGFMEAMYLDVYHVRIRFGSEYNPHIEQMLRYANTPTLQDLFAQSFPAWRQSQQG